MSAPVVVDLSHHNTVSSFDSLFAAGTVGVIHKATQGTSYSDPEFWDRREEATAAGLLWASYHFLTHGDVAAQIDNFLNKVQPQDGERLIIDFEQADCTLDDLHEAITELQARAPDCELSVYSGHLIKDLLGNTRDELLATTSLWIAHYTTAAAPTWPQATWPVWSLWQYSDTGSVPGIKAPTDVNRFNGSLESLRLWFDPYQAPPTPPEPVDQIVRINIEVPDGVAVLVSVNGEPQI